MPARCSAAPAMRSDDARASRRRDDPRRRRSAASLEALSVDLRRAIERGEIAVLFQPQVAIATGAIIGVEALARWEHPEFGAVGAEQLFAAADRADSGIALSDHIQRLALAAAAALARSAGEPARCRST